ncbi:hypothetical protein ACFQ0Q_48095 [Streptomyces aureus]
MFDGPGWPDIPLVDFAPALGERGVRQLADLVEQRAADPKQADGWGTAFGVRATCANSSRRSPATPTTTSRSSPAP